MNRTSAATPSPVAKPHSAIAVKGAKINHGRRSLQEMMEEEPPHIQRHDFDPILFPALVKSLAHYSHVHQQGKAGETNSVSDQSILRRQTRRHSAHAGAVHQHPSEVRSPHPLFPPKQRRVASIVPAFSGIEPASLMALLA